MGQDDFDLVRRKEATGAREFAVPKVQVVLVGHGELMMAALTLLEAFFIVAEAVVFGRFIKNIDVMHDGVRGDAEMGTGRQLYAVRESDGLPDDSVESHCFFFPVSVKAG